MRSNIRCGVTRAIGALAAVAMLAACGDREASAPVRRDTPPISTGPHGVQVERLSCMASVAARTVTCAQPTSATSGASADLIVGGQGTYLQLTSSNVAYDGGTSIFSFDVTVQNLIPQALGTTDGTTSDGTGVRVFFQDGPTVTAGTGTASVANPAGVTTFTGTNQPYFQYNGSDLGGDGILTTNETSASETWQLTVDPTVTSFEFTVYVSTNVHFPNGYVDITGSSPFLLQSGTQTLTATSRTATGNALPTATVTYASSAPAVATVDANSGEVTAVAPGTATITATSSESTTGAVAVQVCPNLAVGESYVTSGADAANVCLGGMGAVTEYTVIPTNSSTSSAISLTLTGNNIQAVTGPPSPTVIPSAGLKLSSTLNGADAGTSLAGAGDDVFGAAATSENARAGAWGGSGQTTNLVHEIASQALGGPYVPDESDFSADVSDGSAAQPMAANGVAPASGGHERLMWYPPSNSSVGVPASVAGAEGGAAPRVDESASDGVAVTTMNAAPVVGDTVQYNTTNACSGSPSVRTGVVRSVSAHAVVVADTANPVGGFTTAQYDSIGLEFDTIAYQVDAANFGTPTDVDGNGHVVLFFTRAVNELSPPASSQVNLGYFARKDVYTEGECTNGNAAEIFYLLVPDPTGVVNSNVRTVSFVRGSVISNAGHELAILINGFGRYQRGVPFEADWLDESLGHLAEELMFYRASVGLSPKQNIVLANLNTGPSASRRVAAFNAYANQNFGRFRSWLQRPDTAGIAGNPNSLARRGLGWAFLRYASDRRGVGDLAFLQSLVTSSDTGLVNIQGAIGGDSPNDWIRDFVGALYADDNAAFSVATRLQTPSWNYRSVYGGLGGFPLQTRALANNTPLTLSYAKGNGASAYGRVGVPASTFATITLSNGGSPPPSTVQLTVIRTK